MIDWLAVFRSFLTFVKAVFPSVSCSLSSFLGSLNIAENGPVGGVFVGESKKPLPSNPNNHMEGFEAINRLTNAIN